MCIVENNLPFSFVESSWLRKLLLTIDPRVEKEFIKRTAMAERVQKAFLYHRVSLKRAFEKNIGRVSFTIDIWSSPNQTSILGMTAHWVDNEWSLKEALLGIAEVSKGHSGIVRN